MIVQCAACTIMDRAQGCLLGQLAGDSLGALVEFRTPEEIRLQYPQGVRLLADGGTWDTLAGQPTDDSEMALMLARTLLEKGEFNADAVLEAYRGWLDSEPFDRGTTISRALRGEPDGQSQSNGALMRVSPLGIFGVSKKAAQLAEWARCDAALTHPHPICQHASMLFVLGIAHAIRTGCDATGVYREIEARALEYAVEPALLETIRRAAEAPPPDYVSQMGWVLTTFGNALWQLLHAPSLEEGVVDTVMRGGDTDTNAAVCGALLGAVYGRSAIPGQWVDAVLGCQPRAGDPVSKHPRPPRFWPTDALELAENLLLA